VFRKDTAKFNNIQLINVHHIPHQHCFEAKLGWKRYQNNQENMPLGRENQYYYIYVGLKLEVLQVTALALIMNIPILFGHF
jgi:hypothetical protein